MQVDVHLSTGLPGLDRALRGLIPGDNIVWQIDSVGDYAPFVQPYCQSAADRGRPLIYFRFGGHEALLADQPGVEVHRLDPQAGFEAFIADIHKVIERSDRGDGALPCPRWACRYDPPPARYSCPGLCGRVVWPARSRRHRS